ncbi:polycystin cation channel [Necator americanus]|uniref:Polycystin cation channel n=1 Tax=Necator americanus TaxID=51031 RepID=W2TVD6_NECAM|nr:polycystin cation channel [Necator americanus]ETN86065.1 polycystin cation channel [Necator americanus]
MQQSFQLNAFRYVWQSAEKLLTETIYGTISSYPGGGFVLRLPVDSSNEASKLIQDAKSNRWIDRSTRAIIIDFAMFNANVNLFCIASLLLELPASGGVLPSYRFSAFDLMRYLGTAGTVMIVFEGILCGFIAYYIILEFMELFRVRLGYFFNFWNIVDIILLSLCCIEIYLNYNRSKVAADRVNEVLQNGLTDAAFDDVITTQENFNNIAAVILFLSWIKVFNYIGVNKTMNQLAATLSRSTKDIGGFAVMFAVFFFAYAQFGYLVFGTQNMFLAIINDSYVEVKAELARQQDGEGIFDWIRKKLTRRGSNNEKIATYNDYKTNLMMAGYNEKDINDAFEKLEIKFTDKVDDNALIEVGNEIREQRNRKKVIDEEYRSIAVLTHRIDMMDRTILGVVDKMSKVLDQLNRIEHSRVQALEHQNRLRAEAMMMKAVRRGEVDEYSDGEREKNRFEE